MKPRQNYLVKHSLLFGFDILICLLWIMIEIKDIEERIKARGIKHTWLMKQLSISRRTFYNRMKDKEFKSDEVSKLKQLGVI